jgi:arylsulfatase A-like enzyme
MSGRAPLALGWSASERVLPDAELSLAECLAAAGYRSAAFCSGASAAAGSGLEQGFETHRAFAAPDEPDPDRAAIQAAGQWLRAAAHAPEPLFLWVHLSGPAPPFDPAPLGATRFDALFADPEYAGNVDGSLASLSGDAARSGAWTGEDLNQISALYDGEIARVAHLLLGLMQLLAGLYPDQQPRDLLAESILVLAGTQGEELYQHGRSFGSADSLHGAALDVPLVLRHPGSMTGSRAFAAVVELQDVLPTLADWLRFEARPPAPWSGRSLLALTDAARAGEFEARPACASLGSDAFAARDERWRLLWWPERGSAAAGGEVQLYDLVRDPLEIADCAAAHPEVVAELRAALAAFRAGAVPAAREHASTGELRD